MDSTDRYEPTEFWSATTEQVVSGSSEELVAWRVYAEELSPTSLVLSACPTILLLSRKKENEKREKRKKNKKSKTENNRPTKTNLIFWTSSMCHKFGLTK
jgi:hypothetical protein